MSAAVVVVVHVWLHATGHRPPSYGPPQYPPLKNAAQSLPVSTHTDATGVVAEWVVCGVAVVVVVVGVGVAGTVAVAHWLQVTGHFPVSYGPPQ